MRNQVMPPACLEADEFAMNLLMPRKMVFEWVSKLLEAEYPRYAWPEAIAGLFGVPEDKAEQRLKDLRL